MVCLTGVNKWKLCLRLILFLIKALIELLQRKISLNMRHALTYSYKPRLFKGSGKRGHTVADTLLPKQMFPRLPTRAIFVADTNFVSGTQKMFLILFRNIFCPQQMFPSLRNLKAAKYEIQKPSTCSAILFLCKFWSMFRVFHLACQLDPQQKHLLQLKKCGALIG